MSCLDHFCAKIMCMIIDDREAQVLGNERYCNRLVEIMKKFDYRGEQVRISEDVVVVAVEILEH